MGARDKGLAGKDRGKKERQAEREHWAASGTGLGGATLLMHRSEHYGYTTLLVGRGPDSLPKVPHTYSAVPQEP